MMIALLNASKHCKVQRLFRLALPGMMILLAAGCPLFEQDEGVDVLSNPVDRVFGGRLAYPTGERPFVVLAGDLNRNGRTDLVTLNWAAETVSILLCLEDGGYDKPLEFEAGATPRAGVLADLSGNTVLDMAIVNEEEAQVTILFGDGDGGFSESLLIALAAGSSPRAIVATDLNGDGITDLAVATTEATTVTIIPGEGGGAFLPPVPFPAGHKPWALWAGDITGNSIVDIVTANYTSNTLSILEGTGTSYLPARQIPYGQGPLQVTGADINKNGMMDLVVGNNNTGDLSLLLASAPGIFEEERRIAFPFPVGKFVVADLNGNAWPDIAGVLFDAPGSDRQPVNRFAVALNDGGNGFQSPALYGAGWGALDIIAADINGTGARDLITADYLIDTVSVAYNRRNGTFESDRRYPTAPGSTKAVLADFTQNGLLDIALMNQNNNTVTVFANKGAGVFDALPPLMLQGKPLTLLAGDINGNGKQDLIVSISLQRNLMLFLATEQGHFLPAAPAPILADSGGAAPEVLSLALGDVNGNSRLDIVTGNSARDSVSVLLNEGDGKFGAPITTNVGNYPLDIHLPDVNGDGNLDLVFLSTRDPQSSNDQADPRVIRWLGTGDGHFDFDTHKRFAVGSGPRALAMADITGNGRQDAVTVHPGDNSVYLLGGLSNGDFSRSTRLRMGDRPMSVTLTDVNRNGRADLVTPLAAGSVILRFSSGDMNFEGPNNFVSGVGMSQTLVADMDGNGLPDLIILNGAKGDMGIILGQQI